jgi:hypothetical protein
LRENPSTLDSPIITILDSNRLFYRYKLLSRTNSKAV